MNEHIEGQEISAYLDSALTAAEAARAKEHLAACEFCRGQYETLRHLKLALSSAPRRTLPAYVALELERRLVEKTPWYHTLTRPLLWAPAGAFATAALAVGVWIHQTKVSAEIPLEPLLAAHARYSAEALLSQENLVASNYSDQLSSLYADAEPELE